MQAAGKKKEAQGRNQEIPDYLVYEVLEGKPVYYKGYKEVLAKNKTLEDIMGSSGLQLVIIEYLLRVLYPVFEPSRMIPDVLLCNKWRLVEVESLGYQSGVAGTKFRDSYSNVRSNMPLRLPLDFCISKFATRLMLDTPCLLQMLTINISTTGLRSAS